MERIIAVYTDGGVIGRNPSSIGGTAGWCAVGPPKAQPVYVNNFELGGTDSKSQRLIERVVRIDAPPNKQITNNITEYIAAVLALEAMEANWSGRFYSDSEITIGRLFSDWRNKNLPPNAIARAKAALARLGSIKPILLEGHPTKLDLERGFGKKGNPVSVHNVWCDKACSALAKGETVAYTKY